jgi:hypothetical protein
MYNYFVNKCNLELTSKGEIMCSIKNRNRMLEHLEELQSMINRQNMRQKITEKHTCPCCLEEIKNGIVILKCSHVYCPSCYAEHSRHDNKCPMCRDEFASKPKKTETIPEQSIDAIIEQMFDSAPNGANKYFEDMAVKIKMRSLRDATNIITYITKANCKLISQHVVDWYDANHN